MQFIIFYNTNSRFFKLQQFCKLRSTCDTLETVFLIFFNVTLESKTKIENMETVFTQPNSKVFLKLENIKIVHCPEIYDNSKINSNDFFFQVLDYGTLFTVQNALSDEILIKILILIISFTILMHFAKKEGSMKLKLCIP